jgi:hypothetical protein
MGIDIHGLNLLRFARKRQTFGRVATIGRQGLHVSHKDIKELLGLDRVPDYGPFCEEFLRFYFGASVVDSFDNSSFEGATHIVDMNKPLPSEVVYDTIFDGGCLEHIYNAPQALYNLSKMCAEGGQILHVLPANNFCGHGFWQFSPELFFSLYSEANGYAETEVFLADLDSHNTWYQVKKPQDGKRAIATSVTPIYVLVRARRFGAFSHENVQQSDYIHAWKQGIAGWNHGVLQSEPVPSPIDKIKRAMKNSMSQQNPLLAVARSINRPINRFFQKGSRLSSQTLSTANPNLIKIAVSSVV